MKTRRLIDKSKSMLKALLMGIFLTSLSSIAWAETNSSQISIDEQVPTTLNIDEAKEIAAFYLIELSKTIPELSEWENSVVEPDITFYDLDGNITAYAFSVMKNSQYDGYIIISATKDKYPILEFSKGKLPTKICSMVNKSQYEITNYANKNKLSIGKSIPIYEGATFYYKEYNLQDNKNATKEKVIVDLATSKIINEDTENLSASTDKAEITDSKEIKEMWNNLENIMTESNLKETSLNKGTVKNLLSTPNSARVTVILPYSKNVTGTVPYYLASYLGCAPAAGAMVLGYWDGKGYSNFPSGNTLISECANAMGTYQYSTNTNMIDDGIETVCSNHGYTNFDAQTDSSLTLSELMSEINSNRPFVLSMIYGGTGSGRSTDYNNHSVACVGYTQTGATTGYAWLHDGWSGSSPHYITFGSWDSAAATWVRP